MIVDGSHGDELEGLELGDLDGDIDFSLLDGCEEGDERAYKRRRIGGHITTPEQHLFPSLDSWFTSSLPLPGGDAAAVPIDDLSALSSTTAIQIDDVASNHSFTSSAPSSLFDEEERRTTTVTMPSSASKGNANGGTGLSACSYDLRNTHEPASVKQEYPNYGSRGHTESDDSKQHFQQWVLCILHLIAAVCLQLTDMAVSLPVPCALHPPLGWARAPRHPRGPARRGRATPPGASTS